MAEPTRQERIAAIKAQRAGAAEDAAEPAAATDPSSRTRRRSPSPTRLAAAGTSVASFAAIVAAMGPLTAQATADETEADETNPASEAVPRSVSPPPTAPNVIVEVIPNYVSERVPSTTAPMTGLDFPAIEAGDTVPAAPSPGQPATTPPPPAAPAPSGTAPPAAASPPVSPTPTAAPSPSPTTPVAPAPTAAPPPPPTTPPPPPTTAPPPPPTTQTSG